MPPEAASQDPLPMLLRSFFLTTMARIYPETVQQAEAGQWSYRDFLLHLCQSEAQERAARLTERLLKASGLPGGKTLETLHQASLPDKVRRQLPALLEGHFAQRAENVLAFGLPGRGKTHFVAALGRELILRHDCPVLFIATYKLVSQLLVAKSVNRLAQFIKKLERFKVIILDDIGYVQQSREEMEVLFTFLAERYERWSVMITSNLVFSQWDKIFKDPMTTMAAVDRLVHHSVILEFDGPSQRCANAQKKPTT
jgi:DNA replication protein DnaC